MKKNLSIVFGFCLLLNTSNVLGEQSATSSNLSDPVKITTVEGITEYQLANGLKVLLFPDMTKETITVNITYLVGSKHENYGETGMAHLLEHLVFKGTPRHPNIPQELTERGARPNGTTWTDRTNYFETFRATEENLRWALDLESDRMINSFISKEDLDSEMTVVRNEFEAGENSPWNVIWQRILSAAFEWHNYGKSTIGARSDIENVPIGRLQNFYKTYYQPDNAVLVVVGKIDEEKTIAMVNEYFGPIPRPTRELPEFYTRDPDQDGEKRVIVRRVGDAQIVGTAFKTSALSHEDAAPLELLGTILTDNPSGRLYKALVDTQIASYVYGVVFLWKDPGILMAFAEVPNEKSIETARDAMLKAYAELIENPVTELEVNRAKINFLKNFDLAFNSSEGIGLQLSEYIGAGDWRLMFIQRDRVRDVTAEDVKRVAANYLKEDNRTVGMFIPVDKPDRTIIPKDVNITDLVSDYRGGEGLEAGEAFDPNPDNIESRTVRHELSNGMKIAFLNKKTRGSSVNFNFTFRFGNENNLKNKGLIGDYTAGLLDKGTASKSREEIKDEFDRLKANVSFFGTSGSFSIYGETVRENLPEVLILIKEILQEASFPKEELDKMISEYITSIESQMSDPIALASNRMSIHNNPYEKDDPRYELTFEESIAAHRALKLEDIRNFHKEYYGANHGTVAIVGDLDEEKVLDALKDMLENWNSKAEYQRLQGRLGRNPVINEALETPDKPNAFFLATQQFELNDSHEDYPALVLGNFMLGGGFLNSRLAVRIRQKEGISYGVGSGFFAGAIDKIGTFQTYAIYAPENLERLEKAFKEEVTKVLEEGFTEEEVAAAKSGWLQNRSVSRSQDNYLASTLNGNLFLDRTIMREQELEDKVNSLTPQHIQQAMKRHLDLQKMSIVKAGEFKK